MPELFTFSKPWGKRSSWEKCREEALNDLTRGNRWSVFLPREDQLEAIWLHLIHYPSAHFLWLQNLSFRIYPDAGHPFHHLLIDRIVINKFAEVLWNRNSGPDSTTEHSIVPEVSDSSSLPSDPQFGEFLKEYASYLIHYFDSLLLFRGEYVFPALFGRVATVYIDRTGIYIDEDPTLIPKEADTLWLVRDLNQKENSLHEKINTLLFSNSPEPWVRSKEIQKLLNTKSIGTVRTEQNWILLFFRKICGKYPALKSFEWQQFDEYDDSWYELELRHVRINETLRCNYYTIQLNYRIEEPTSWKTSIRDPDDWEQKLDAEKNIIPVTRNKYTEDEISQLEKGSDAVIMLLRSLFDSLRYQYLIYVFGNRVSVKLSYDGIFISAGVDPE